MKLHQLIKLNGEPSPFDLEFIDKTKHMNSVEAAFFYGQIAHESSNFKRIDENLNYSKSGLLSVFPKYFNESSANQYQRKPEKIANRVYSNRMGNGNEQSGDGWKYRGRGLIQITGKDNYTELAKDLYIPFSQITKYITTPAGAVESAIWFWNKHDLSKYALDFDIANLTLKINGGKNGIESRANKTIHALTVLNWVLEVGCTNSDTVAIVQRVLNKRFSCNLVVDGDFGQKTKKVCEKFLGSSVIGPVEYKMLMKF